MFLRLKKALILYRGFTTLAVVNFFLWLGISGVAYANAGFLSQFISPTFVSIAFTLQAIGALGGIYAVMMLSRVFSAYPVLLFAIPLLLSTILFLGTATGGISAVFWFILFGVFAYSAAYLLDLFVEGVSSESETGTLRGWFITTGTLAVFLAPILIGLFVVNEAYTPLYILMALSLLPALTLSLTALRNITPAPPKCDSFVGSLRSLFREKRSVLLVMGAHLLLQTFFAWMIIYSPLYLLSEGFSWQVISLIIASALLPFLILEVPLGIVADRHWGEKEIMAVGFVILSLSTALLTFIPLSLILFWATVFFISRIGAAMVEIATESYFFKQVNEENASLVSLFRMLRPAGILFGSLVGAVSLSFLPISSLFFVFGIILSVGILMSAGIVDTK